MVVWQVGGTDLVAARKVAQPRVTGHGAGYPDREGGDGITPPDRAAVDYGIPNRFWAVAAPASGLPCVRNRVQWADLTVIASLVRAAGCKGSRQLHCPARRLVRPVVANRRIPFPLTLEFRRNPFRYLIVPVIALRRFWGVNAAPGVGSIPF